MSDATAVAADEPEVPDIDLPSDAFDAVLDALADREPGDSLHFEGFSVARGAGSDRDDESDEDAPDEYVLANGDRQTGLSERDLHEALDDRAAAVTDWYAFERVVGEFGPAPGVPALVGGRRRRDGGDPVRRARRGDRTRVGRAEDYGHGHRPRRASIRRAPRRRRGRPD